MGQRRPASLRRTRHDSIPRTGHTPSFWTITSTQLSSQARHMAPIHPNMSISHCRRHSLRAAGCRPWQTCPSPLMASLRPRFVFCGSPLPVLERRRGMSRFRQHKYNTLKATHRFTLILATFHPHRRPRALMPTSLGPTNLCSNSPHTSPSPTPRASQHRPWPNNGTDPTPGWRRDSRRRLLSTRWMFTALSARHRSTHLPRAVPRLRNLWSRFSQSKPSLLSWKDLCLQSL